MKVVATFHPPSSVIGSLKCNLVRGQEHLVVGKADRLEVFSLQPEGLRRECGLEIWGRVVSLKAIPVNDAGPSNLLVLTDHPDPKLIILGYGVDEAGAASLVNKDFVDLYDRHARPAEFVTDVLVDPSEQVAVVSCYTGRLKIVQFKNGKLTGVPFDISIPELFVLALTFLHTEQAYTLGILHLDHLQRIQLLSRDLDLADLSAPTSTLLVNTIISPSVLPSPTAAETPPRLIPVPPYTSPDEDEDKPSGSHLGGVLVVGGRKILFFEHASAERQEVKKSKQRRASKRLSSSNQAEAAKAKVKEKERDAKKIKPKAGVKWPWSDVTAWTAVDEGGRRFLLGDTYGRLSMLAFDETSGLVLIPLGEVSPPTSLTYLASQAIYLGSHLGDSQLLQIHPTPKANLDLDTLPIPSGISTVLPSSLSQGSSKGKESADVDLGSSREDRNGKVVATKGSYVEVLESYQNIAPIMDAVMVDLDGSGQPQIITCSGGHNTGSLKVVRTGADFQERAVINGVSNVVDVWSLRSRFEDTLDTHLVASTLKDTYVFSINGTDAVTRLDPTTDGLITTSPTLAMANIPRRVTINNGGRNTSSYVDSSLVVQITPEKAHLAEYDSALGLFMPVGSGWAARQEGRSIVAASLNPSQFVIGLSGGRLTLLNLGENREFQVLKHRDFFDAQHGPLEISAISCSPFDPSKKFATYIAVSFWGTQHVAILSLESASAYLTTLCETAPLSALPRSLVLHNFGSGRKRKEADFHPHLLAGLADGTVVTFNFKDNELKDKKVFPLGILPVTLATCTVDGKTAVLAKGSRASLMYWDRQRLQQSPVMLKDVAGGASLNSSAFPSCLVLATSSTLIIGNVRGVDKMQIRSILLGLDNPRRIAYNSRFKLFGLACIRTSPPRVGEAEERLSSFKVVNDTTFENLGSFSCELDEEIVSILALPGAAASNTASFCIGTVRIHPEEGEPSSGRILLISVSSNDESARRGNPTTIKLVATAPVTGCVYQLAYVEGLIAAAINSSVTLFRIESVNGLPLSLNKVTDWNHNYAVTSLVVNDDTLIVGDAISSISMLRVDGNQLRTVARDYSPLWPVAVEASGKKGVIGANSDCNIFTFTLQRFDNRTALERDGSYFLGDVVNKFLSGGLASADVSDGDILKPSHLFFTSTGRIGVVVDMNDQISLQMTALQRNMAKTINGPGDTHHPRWRAPANSKGHSDAESAFGFLDGDFLEQYLNDLKPERFLAGETEVEHITMPSAQIQAILDKLQSLH